MLLFFSPGTLIGRHIRAPLPGKVLIGNPAEPFLGDDRNDVWAVETAVAKPLLDPDKMMLSRLPDEAFDDSGASQSSRLGDALIGQCASAFALHLCTDDARYGHLTGRKH